MRKASGRTEGTIARAELTRWRRQYFGDFIGDQRRRPMVRRGEERRIQPGDAGEFAGVEPAQAP